jgi:hypothetical protein
MRFKTTIATLAIAGIMGISGALAQTPAPATPGATGAGAPATAAPDDKAAISKDCYAQADAQNLHGKARKHFHSKCKKNGGKM